LASTWMRALICRGEQVNSRAHAERPVSVCAELKTALAEDRATSGPCRASCKRCSRRSRSITKWAASGLAYGHNSRTGSRQFFLSSDRTSPLETKPRCQSRQAQAEINVTDRGFRIDVVKRVPGRGLRETCAERPWSAPPISLPGTSCRQSTRFEMPERLRWAEFQRPSTSRASEQRAANAGETSRSTSRAPSPTISRSSQPYAASELRDHCSVGDRAGESYSCPLRLGCFDWSALTPWSAASAAPAFTPSGLQRCVGGLPQTRPMSAQPTQRPLGPRYPGPPRQPQPLHASATATHRKR
jgi:hypothetical protein